MICRLFLFVLVLCQVYLAPLTIVRNVSPNLWCLQKFYRTTIVKNLNKASSYTSLVKEMQMHLFPLAFNSSKVPFTVSKNTILQRHQTFYNFLRKAFSSIDMVQLCGNLQVTPFTITNETNLLPSRKTFVMAEDVSESYLLLWEIYQNSKQLFKTSLISFIASVNELQCECRLYVSSVHLHQPNSNPMWRNFH